MITLIYKDGKKRLIDKYESLEFFILLKIKKLFSNRNRSFCAFNEQDGKMYLHNGQYHNLNGPAIFLKNKKHYFINGCYYTEQEWKQKIRKIKLKKILNETKTNN